MNFGTDPQNEKMPRVVIAGGGVAALEGVLCLRALMGDRADIEVWAPEQDFVYAALSVAVPFMAGETRRFPLDQLVASAGAVLRRGRLRAVDPGRRVAVTDIGDVPYDALVLALGARSKPALEGALTFRGPEDDQAFASLLDQVATGSARHLAFVLPPGATRHLPLYELALESRNYLSDRVAHDVAITIVSPDDSLFAAFGSDASDEFRQLLADRHIQVVLAAEALEFKADELRLGGGHSIAADHVLAMARLEGPRVPGIPCDADGFVQVDDHCRVPGVDGVYAAGDMTSFPMKHGGIAAEQADAAVEMIASTMGLPVEPTPFHAVLRSKILTGMFPRYLRLDAESGHHTFSTEAPWWPPAKIVGRYLTPFLVAELGLTRTDPPAGAAPGNTVLEWQPGGGWASI